MAKGKGKPPANPYPAELLKAVVSERGDDTITLIVPSHDNSRPQKELPNQDQWADAALRLFGRLYGGATAFVAHQGIWLYDKRNELFDRPILIESLTKREYAEDESKLLELVEFAQRMCRETSQDCVAVICNDTIHFIKG